MVRSVRVAKRLIDVVGSLLGLAITLPFFPLIAAAVYIDSPGAIFIRQRRAGQLGRAADEQTGNRVSPPKFREFFMLKFRSMRPDAEKHTGPVLATANDPRITRVGRILRKTRIDELPQFINVLLGHMSIVGPRPHMLKDTNEFSNLVSNYQFRNMARPGITGLSQVRGYRGPATTFESIFRRYQWDSYYVRNVSFTLDMKIMIGTALLMMRSLFHKDQPVPLDNNRPVYNSEPLVSAKKIA